MIIKLTYYFVETFLITLMMCEGCSSRPGKELRFSTKKFLEDMQGLEQIHFLITYLWKNGSLSECSIATFHRISFFYFCPQEMFSTLLWHILGEQRRAADHYWYQVPSSFCCTSWWSITWYSWWVWWRICFIPQK